MLYSFPSIDVFVYPLYDVVSLAVRRRSSPRQPALPPASDQDWTDVETRCSVAIEGHPAGRYKAY